MRTGPEPGGGRTKPLDILNFASPARRSEFGQMILGAMFKSLSTNISRVCVTTTSVEFSTGTTRSLLGSCDFSELTTSAMGFLRG